MNKHMVLISAIIAASTLILACGEDSSSTAAQNTGDEEGNNTPQTGTQVSEDPREKPADDGILRVLAIGNSFSEDAVGQELYPLFASDGRKVIIAQAYISGCDLQTHYQESSNDTDAYSYRKIVDGTTTKTTAKMSYILGDEKWDYISFQQGGGHHGEYSTFEPYLSNMINLCREKAAYKNFKVIFHAPWVAPATSTNAKFGFYGYNVETMYAGIVDATKKADDNHHFDIVINSFDAVQNGRTSYLGDTFDRDGWHLNMSYGRYTVSCLWYEKLTGKSVLENSYHPESISDDVAFVCKTAAHEAALHPYMTVDLSYIENPNPPSPEEGTVLAEWEFNATNAVNDGYISTFTGLSDVQSNLGVWAYNNNAGELGYVLSNKVAGGKISYVQTNKTAWDVSSGNERGGTWISTGGLPSNCASLDGDYYLLEAGSDDFSAGSSFHVEYSWNSSKYGNKYWILEYLDGKEWKPAPGLEVKTETISGTTYDTKEAFSNDITYNLSFAASEKRTISIDFTLTEVTEGAKVRMTCCLEYQVNGRHFLHPRTQSVQYLDNTTQPKFVLLPKQ